MNEDLAHSAAREYGIPAQSYRSHVEGVFDGAARNAEILSRFCPTLRKLFLGVIPVAAEYHDLGKLHKPNQIALAHGGKGRLPINHTDAGTAFLSGKNPVSAVLIHAHHIGLPNIVDEIGRGKNSLRDDHAEIRELVRKDLGYLLSRHRDQFSREYTFKSFSIKDLTPMTYRMLLSGGIVDPDWGNTSQNYHNIVPIDDIELRPKARLKHLDAYVKGLGNKRDKRSRLRREVYKKSRTCNKMDPMLLCELPVGVGKATATMATILKIAAKKGLNRIFVVQPFTTIIDQTVDVYRKALTLPDEDCNNKRIIAAHHHRVDYENEACRQYAATWSSPIVVTTAVQFFETLASNQPSALRKLHHVPGSLIIIDEFHCALPPHLLQLAWGWLKELVEKWSCHVLFSSGSSIRFWEMEEFAGEAEKIRSIVPVSLFDKAIKQEKLRVEPRFWNKRHSIKSLCEWALNSAGPRVIVLNTVQSTAVIARYLIRKEGNSKVEHISNGLNPIHREAALARVKERLKDKRDTDWTLVATSCVESGLNLSFRTGFCEERSLMSALQIAGRINRDNEYKNAVLHVFCLAYNRYLREHPAFNTARAVLREMFKQKKVSPEYCTEAFEREIHRRSSSVAMKELAKDEKALQFKDVAAGFQIIAGGTMTVVLPEMAERLRRGEKVNWWEIQDNSIQVWEKNAQKWGVTPIFGFEEISEWTLGYDSKLGIMAGILPLIDAERKNIFII